MTTSATSSSDRVNGLRTLELGAALCWLKEQMAIRLQGGTRTISTVGARSRNEQEIVGMMQILVVMLPLAIELALKSLKAYLDSNGNYQHIHHLDNLFSSLTVNAANPNKAQKVQNEARDSWDGFQNRGLVSYSGTLEEFLEDNRNDFIDIRYYDWSELDSLPLNDFIVCYFSVLQPLITRDLDTQANFLGITAPDILTTNFPPNQQGS